MKRHFLKREETNKPQTISFFYTASTGKASSPVKFRNIDA
jgi:hypothetical protein